MGVYYNDVTNELFTVSYYGNSKVYVYGERKNMLVTRKAPSYYGLTYIGEFLPKTYYIME